MEPEEKQLWLKYKKTLNEDLRNTLVEKYLPMVKYVADRIIAKLPKTIIKDDLMSVGIDGLIDAVEKFDVNRGVKFQTYCINRIRGSILDELRSLDWVPRLVRTRTHQLEKVYSKLETKLGRIPSDGELADELGISLEEYGELLKEINTQSILSLNRNYSDDPENEESSSAELVEDKKAPAPAGELQARELVEFVTQKLSKKERLIMLLYYCEDLTMKEIGAILELSESRVSQIHARLLLKLRSEWKKSVKNILENC